MAECLGVLSVYVPRYGQLPSVPTYDRVSDGLIERVVLHGTVGGAGRLARHVDLSSDLGRVNARLIIQLPADGTVRVRCTS